MTTGAQGYTEKRKITNVPQRLRLRLSNQWRNFEHEVEKGKILIIIVSITLFFTKYYYQDPAKETFYSGSSSLEKKRRILLCRKNLERYLITDMNC